MTDKDYEIAEANWLQNLGLAFFAAGLVSAAITISVTSNAMSLITGLPAVAKLTNSTNLTIALLNAVTAVQSSSLNFLRASELFAGIGIAFLIIFAWKWYGLNKRYS